ncbi:hypothetical protein EMPS_10449 [Entomortierella parvispora]|uniref:HCNGP-domain-containing protein n=1 Tax=Entomortierella parvispora TaxID=205924 RepID=A0A9P3HJX9_9FUNG|nr:hypothetical protein EMPS_10449 [Entomortierella parvispora]
MNKGLLGLGLVAYGDSDSEGSDSEAARSVKPNVQESEKESTSETGSIQATDKGSASDRPLPQDTISARTLVANARPSANDSLGKIAITNSLKQGIIPASSTSDQEMPQREDRSPSGTPLPADHSAAAEVMNTPTTGMSPKAMKTTSLSIDEERVETTPKQGEHTTHSTRSSLMRSLLRPRPISGVENFGIPPEPEGEVDPDVQAKIEGFQKVKEQRGIHFNQSLMKNKNFRNPHIYTSLVEFVALNEFGTNFEKSEFFDFEGYGPESYATGLAEAQKLAAERLAQQQSFARSHLQFVPGQTTVSGGGALGLIPRVSQVASVGSIASSSLAAPAGGLQRGGRKSKWDTQVSDDPSTKRARH